MVVNTRETLLFKFPYVNSFCLMKSFEIVLSIVSYFEDISKIDIPSLWPRPKHVYVDISILK